MKLWLVSDKATNKPLNAHSCGEWAKVWMLAQPRPANQPRSESNFSVSIVEREDLPEGVVVDPPMTEEESVADFWLAFDKEYPNGFVWES